MDKPPERVMSVLDGAHRSIIEWLQNWLEEPSICNCSSPKTIKRIYDEPPLLLVFSLNTSRVEIRETIHIKGINGRSTILLL